MGWCTYFSKTWIPGYGAEFIDPNKAFNFERRVRIIKRIVIALIILAVLVALGYLLVSLTGGNNKNCPNTTVLGQLDNMTNAEASALENTNASDVQPTPEQLNQASLLILTLPSNATASAADHENSSKIDDRVSHEVQSEQEKIIQSIFGTNSSTLIQDDISKILNESEVALVNFEKAIGNLGSNISPEEEGHKRHTEEAVMFQNETTVTPVMTGETAAAQTHLLNSTDALHQNNTATATLDNKDVTGNRTKFHNATNEMWCSYTHNVLECVALSKNFKQVTTFFTNRTYDGTVEGYVVVKVNDTWHPYCRQQTWNLKMAYSLCKGFGFKNLDRLNTIDIAQLKHRITSLGTNVSLQPGNQPQREDMLVFGGNNGTSDESKERVLTGRNTDSTEFPCKVGFVACNNNL